jgi:hypothetical protein
MQAYLPPEAILTSLHRRLQSVSMQKSILFWISLFLPFFTGCGNESAQTLPPQYQKITLQDLKPVDVQSLQSQILFDLVTFEIPVNKVNGIALAMAGFDLKHVRFYNKELFWKNGLSAYYGRGADSDKLPPQLRLLGARHVVRTSLITMDKADEMFPTTIFPDERYVFSTLYGDRIIGQTFAPGKIGWVISPSLTVRRDTVNVKIVPAYVSAEGANIRIAAGKNELGQKPFGQGRFEVTMQEGDFLVLAPGRVSTETTLDKMLFGPEGPKGKMRLYVILFIRVEQG